MQIQLSTCGLVIITALEILGLSYLWLGLEVISGPIFAALCVFALTTTVLSERRRSSLGPESVTIEMSGLAGSLTGTWLGVVIGFATADLFLHKIDDGVEIAAELAVVGLPVLVCLHVSRRRRT